MLRCFSCVRLFATLWTVAHQAHCPWDSSGKNTGVDFHSLFRESSWSRDQTHVSCIASGFFTTEQPGSQLVLFLLLEILFYPSPVFLCHVVVCGPHSSTLLPEFTRPLVALWWLRSLWQYQDLGRLCFLLWCFAVFKVSVVLFCGLVSMHVKEMHLTFYLLFPQVISDLLCS